MALQQTSTMKKADMQCSFNTRISSWLVSSYFGQHIWFNLSSIALPIMSPWEKSQMISNAYRSLPAYSHCLLAGKGRVMSQIMSQRKEITRCNIGQSGAIKITGRWLLY